MWWLRGTLVQCPYTEPTGYSECTNIISNSAELACSKIPIIISKEIVYLLPI